MPKPIQGVFPILVTPFAEAGRIDVESLQRLIEFNLAAGVHGLGVALGSEIFKLSESVRDDVTRVVVTQVNGRVPVVINSGAPGTLLAVHYSRPAQELGATSEDVCEYYERGLHAPGDDYETPPPYLHALSDPLDAEGYVHLSQEPGMGYQINWDYIKENRV